VARITGWRQTAAVLTAIPFVLTAAAANTLWRPDATRAAIPRRQAAGTVGGAPFRVERAELQCGILTLRQGAGFFADREFTVFLFPRTGEKLSGRSFTVHPDGGDSSPHVWVKWKPAGDGLPKSEAFVRGYTMRLQFLREKDGRLPGRIYLRTPDARKSFVAGYFTAVIQPSGRSTARATTARASAR
jgi:hypothetical protein